MSQKHSSLIPHPSSLPHGADDLGEADQRAEVRRGDARVLRRYVQQPRLAYPRAVGRRDDQTAPRDPEVERLQQVRLRFEQYIPAHHTAVRDPVLDVNRHVRGLDEDETVAARFILDGKSARRERARAEANARPREKPERVFLRPPFGDGDGQRKGRGKG